MIKNKLHISLTTMWTAFLIFLSVLIFATIKCDATTSNLTKETTIANSINILASPSAVLSDCFSKNSVSGAGGNTKNCDDLMELYIDIYRQDHPKPSNSK